MSKLNHKLEQEEQMVPCIYNSFHIVTRHRLQKHLLTCRNAYQGNDIGICRFNVAHHIRYDEMRDHELVCSDRVVVEKIALSAKRKPDPVQTSSGRQSAAASEDVDDWDKADEMHVRTPQEKRRRLEEQSTAIVHFQNMTRSEKREARERRHNEVVRMQQQRSANNRN